MTNRLLGITAIVVMLCANTALLLRDVFPVWLAEDPPEPVALQLVDGEEVRVQYGLFDRERRIGCAWSVSHRTDETVTVRHITALEPLDLPGGVRTPALAVETTMRYRGAAHLEELRVQVRGLGFHVVFSGEYFPPDDFACEWQVGDRRGQLVFPAERTRAIGDVLRPFGGLTGLEVGRSWRVKVINPLAGVIPGWAERMAPSGGVLARVVAKERIEHGGEMLDAFVIDADRIRAWVAPDGTVIRQELELPVLGLIRIEQEPFDRAVQRASLHAGARR